MKVILANPRGFCAGVNMAIDVVDQVLKLQGPPVYVFHEIVHNRSVVNDFRSRGVVFVGSVDQVPPGSTIIYSAHGISPDVRQASKSRGLKEVDATCPLVTKVHMEVLRYARLGYTILFVGHRRHDEAVGTVGEAPDRIIVVENESDVRLADVKDPKKVAFVTQTTLSVCDAERIIAAIRQRFPDVVSPAKDDICYATTNRQNAVSSYAPEADVVLVIGSQNSSNSQRLADRAREVGKTAYLIDQAAEIEPAWLANAGCVLVTAGASAPEHLVEALLDRLTNEFAGVVEVRTLVDEDVSFDPPKSLKSLSVVR